MSYLDQFPGDSRPSFEGTWERLNQVAVKGAEYNSPERQPHSKCLEGTREDLQNYIYGLLDDREKNHFIWLHGMAGVGKSAIAFTVAERMRNLKVAEGTKEKRLAGTFFFSRKRTKRRTTGYFFATLAYQLASNFPSIREDVNHTIRYHPALLDPNKSVMEQMEALFLQPLRRLRVRLLKALPLVFVVDALDECTSEPELVYLISLLGQALREPDLPVTHILLTSRSEDYIRKAIQTEDIRPLLCEIPVNASRKGVVGTVPLYGADVDNDICIFLQHSFRELKRRHPKFPQPSRDQLTKLASRAGGRFIVASTMMKFIDDRDNDPCDRLQLTLELTSELLPGTEVYKLYNLILSTCAQPEQAYLYLSVVAALADPLPLSQISELLGPGLGRDVEAALVQLRSVIDIPSDSSLPVNIYHSSVHDYVSDPSNCSLRQVQHVTPPHSLLAHSTLHLIMQDIPKSTALLDAILELKRHSQAMQPHDPRNLKHSLAFMVQPPEPLQVLMGLLWLRGDRSSDLQIWLETLDGCAWLKTQEGRDWLRARIGQEWLQTPSVREWLQTCDGREWLVTPRGREWLMTQRGRDWLEAQGGREWLRTYGGQQWLKEQEGPYWLQTQGGQEWLQTFGGRTWLQTQFEGQDWLQIQGGKDWLQTLGGQDWLQTRDGQDWLKTFGGRDWLRDRSEREQWHISVAGDRLQTPSGRVWLRTRGGRVWLQTLIGREWLQTPGGKIWLSSEDGWEWKTWCMQAWLRNPGGQDWMQMRSWQNWLQTESGRDCLETLVGQDWLETQYGQDWLQTQDGKGWLQTSGGRDWLQTSGGRDWLHTHGRQHCSQMKGRHDWLQTWSSFPPSSPPSSQPSSPSSSRLSFNTGGQLQISVGAGWFQTPSGQDWLQTLNEQKLFQIPDLDSTSDLVAWLKTPDGEDWLETSPGEEWLQTPGGQDWLQTQGGRDWLQTSAGEDWLETPAGEDWLQAPCVRDWLQNQGGRDWLQTQHGRNWLETQGGRDWLETQSGQEWLQTPHGQAWRLTTVWVTMEEFSSTLETIRKYITIPHLPPQPAFQAVQQFNNLPDFLMLPAFLALRHQDPSTSALPDGRFPPDIEVVRAIKAFSSFANKARQQSRSASDALKYACQNWAVHLSRAQNPWDDRLTCLFKSFWNRHLLSWLERQWCLKDLRSCLAILSEGETLANYYALENPGSSSQLRT